MFQRVLTGLALILYGVSCTEDYDWDAPGNEFCVRDNTQSPRAIDTNSLLSGEDICTPHLNWIINHHTTWKIVNTGHTVKLQPWDPVNNVTLTTNITTIATLPNQFNTQDELHQMFCFDSFHFHWGAATAVGSEHTINDRRYELEIHFVHYSCSYSNLGGALSFTSDPNNVIEIADKYTLGVIGVMAEKSDTHNDGFDKILEQLPNILYPTGTEPNVPGEAIITDFDIAYLLPQERQEFYYYEGSLTTPTCDPVVRWHVMRNGITISEDQLQILRSLRNKKNITESDNYREIQANINPVYECFDTTSNNDDNNSNNDDAKVKKKLKEETILMIVVGLIALIVICGACFAFFKCKQKETQSKKYVQMINETLTETANDAERM